MKIQINGNTLQSNRRHGAHLDIGCGTDRANDVGQASSLSDERASASITRSGFSRAAPAELNARAVRSPDRREACPTVGTSAARQLGAVSRCTGRHSAFTLVEILLVVVIIGILAALVIPKIAGTSERARITAAGADINGGIKSALGQYEVDCGFYPRSLQDLMVQPRNARNWHGPYLEKLPLDPWGNPYVYHFPGKHVPGSYDLISVGPDGKEGTDDDVVSWQ